MKTMRQWMVCLLLLAYVGQSLAAVATPCAEMDPDVSGLPTMPVANDGMTPPVMDHCAQHMTAEAPAGVDTNTNTNTNSFNCCDGGLCSMSHCLAVAAIIPAGYSSVAPLAPAHGGVLSVSSPIDIPTSLYRPPISR
jgi:hypothetical protein